MSLIALTQLQASSGEWVSFGLRSRRSLPPSLWVPSLCFTSYDPFVDSWSSWLHGARLSSAPPPPFPFPRTTVLVPIPSLPTGEYFRGRPACPLPVGSPWPRTRRPPNRCQGPVPYPPSPFLCHALSPPHLDLNRHMAVVLWAVPPPRHWRGHGPSLPWLPTNGSRTIRITAGLTFLGAVEEVVVRKVA